MASKPLPTPQEILEFINASSTKVGKREIARAFSLKGLDRVWLKTLLKKMAEEGLIVRGHKKKVHSRTHLPPVILVTVSPELSEDGEILLIPVEHESDLPLLLTDKGTAHVNSGDRLLVRLKRHPDGYYTACLLKKMAETPQKWVGMVIKTRGKLYLQPCDRRRQNDLTPLDPKSSVKEGEVVLAELSQQLGSKQATVLKSLGTLEDPRVISLISIYEQGIPHEFSEATLDEAENVRELSLEGREDLRSIPFVTIDGEDARDFDDAVWAHEDPEKGWHLMVAIADVAFYVKPGSALDKEASPTGLSPCCLKSCPMTYVP